MEAERAKALAAKVDEAMTQKITDLQRIRGIGANFSAVLVREVFYRSFANRRQLASYVGIAPMPYQSGGMDRDRGISRAGNPRARTTLIQLAWLWLRYQPGSVLSSPGPEKLCLALKPIRRLHAETQLTAEPSCKDEARIGQKNGLVRQWARRGTRPRQPADQRYESAYLFGAICPARGVGAALALPFADTEAMQLHLEEISAHVAEGAHAVLLLDRAGWHTTAKLDLPNNITPIFLPSRAPEPGREHLAVLTRQLAFKPGLRNLRRHRRRRLRRLAKTHRPAGNHNLHRNARLGPYRSDPVVPGIRHEVAGSLGPGGQPVLWGFDFRKRPLTFERPQALLRVRLKTSIRELFA